MTTNELTLGTPDEDDYEDDDETILESLRQGFREAMRGEGVPIDEVWAMVDENVTDNYYDVNGQSFFNRSVGLDVTPLHEAFLAYIPAGGRILDAGCGSGRDTKVFAERGYQVTAFDASETMARLASEFTGLPVAQMRFEDVAYESEFDGIWTAATLLHVPRKNLDEAFSRLLKALKVGGHWYMSFKKGQGERVDADGRLFLDFELAELIQYAEGFEGAQVVKAWENADTSRGFEVMWVNAIVGKSDSKILLT